MDAKVLPNPFSPFAALPNIPGRPLTLLDKLSMFFSALSVSAFTLKFISSAMTCMLFYIVLQLALMFGCIGSFLWQFPPCRIPRTILVIVKVELSVLSFFQY
jgi:hypothetical protein